MFIGYDIKTKERTLTKSMVNKFTLTNCVHNQTNHL